VGSTEIVGRVVEDLKDESEPYRRMVMETITKVVEKLGTADIDARLEVSPSPCRVAPKYVGGS
jgi:splicing factor 3B subunit 1